MAAIIDYIENFEYVPGETPLTDYQVPLAIGAGYLMSVFILKRFMANREKIEARLLSIVHNFNMLAISVICFFGIGYGIFDILRVSITSYFHKTFIFNRKMVFLMVSNNCFATNLKLPFGKGHFISGYMSFTSQSFMNY